MKVTRKDWIDKDEIYCDWYKCPSCGLSIMIYSKYCSNCGVKLEWDIKKETK